MKAHLIDTHLLVPRSRSSAKVKVKYQGHVSQKWVFRAHLCFTNTSCFTMFSSLPKTILQILSHIFFVICKCSSFGPAKQFVVWEKAQVMIMWDCLLTLSQTANFRPFQNERVCRRQF